MRDRYSLMQAPLPRVFTKRKESRMNKPVLLLLALLMTVSMPLPTVAAGLGFLKNSPVYYFDDADRKLMNEAVVEVLNEASGESSREWKNPRTGSSGKVQGMGRFRSADGLDCRKLKLFNQARGIEGEATYPVCRADGGEWRLASGKELTKI